MNDLIALTKNKHFLFKLILLLLFIVLPWSLNNSSDELNAQEITDDLSFYQINTCEFSLIEVLIENLKLHIRNTLNLDLIITPRIDVLERLLGLTELEILFL